MLTPRVVREKQKNNRRDEQSSADSWREVTGFFFLLLLTSCQLVPNTEDKPKVIENPTFHGPESQGEARSVPFIPGQEYQKFDYKIKRIRRKKRSGVKGRRKRPRVIRYHQYEGTAEGGGDDEDDVGLFTRLWRWFGSFFTRKTTSATKSLYQEEQRDVCLEDAAAKTTVLPKDVDIDKKQTGLHEEKIVELEKHEDNKETATIKEEEQKAKDVIMECPDDSSIEKQKEMILEIEKASSVKDSCANENVVSGCYTVQQLETHVLQQTEDPKRFDLVPLKQLENKPSSQLPVDTAIETSSSGPGCCQVRTLETHVLQQTKDPKRFDLVPLKQLENKPSSQLPVDTAIKTSSSCPGCCQVRTLETHVLQQTKDPKRFDLVPLKQLENKPSSQLPVDTAIETSSGPGCCKVRTLETHVLQQTKDPKRFDLVPLKQLESKPSSQLSENTTAETPSSAPEPSCVVQNLKLETHVEPNQNLSKKIDHKVKVIKRKKRSGVKGRRKRKRVIRYQENEGTTEDVDEDVGLFTRLWQWICSFFTRKPTAATTSLQQEEQRDVHLDDAAKTTSLLLDVDGDRKKTDLDETKLVELEKDDDNKETTTYDVREEERKSKDVIIECHDDCCIENQKEMTLENEKAWNVEDNCTNEGIVYGCYSVRQLEAHIPQETEDLEVFDLVPLKKLESKLAQLPVAEGSVEARNKTVMENDGDKGILDNRSMSDLRENDNSKPVSVVPLLKKQPEHKVATAPRGCKRSTNSKRKNAPSATSGDAELSRGPSTTKLQPSKERSTIFKGNGQNDSRKQADFVRPRQPDREAKDHVPSTKRYYEPRKNSSKPNSRKDQDNYLSWRNGSKESAESSKGHAYSSWGNQKKGSQSFSSSSNWRRSSSKGDISSNWRKYNGTDNPVAKSQTFSRRKGTDNTRTSSNDGTFPNRRNNKDSKAEPCESNWRMRTESRPWKQRNDIKEKLTEKSQTSTREKAQQDVQESKPKMTYAQALMGVSSPPAVMRYSPARAVPAEARSLHGQRQRRSNPIYRR